MGAEDSWGGYRLLSAIVLCCFVLLFGFLTITSSLEKSPTFDETVHLFAGYSYLKWGDFRINPEHPPFAKILAALPLLGLEINDGRRSNADLGLIVEKRDYSWWAVANEIIYSDNDAETLFFYARLSMIVLGILLGTFVYLWAKELYGFKAAVGALFIYCLDPNILAHSQIVHTDIPLTTFFFIGTYFFWRTFNQLTWSNLLLTSLFFGLAAITKYTFVTIIPIWGILGLLKIFSSKPVAHSFGVPQHVSSRLGKAALLTGILLSALVTAYILIWASYRFRFDPILEGEDRHLPVAQVMPKDHFRQMLVSFGIQHHLFPEAWIYGFLYVNKRLKRFTYLLGQVSENGFWLYFPVAFAVKTPLPTLFILIGAIGIWVFKRKVRAAELFLIIPALVYFCLAVLSQLNIGLRHLLPIYPFLFVLIGGTIAELWRDRSGFKKAGLIVLGLWYVWSSVDIYPDYLAFFNELAGGAKNGYKVLADSSLDWGQDLKGLKSWMDKNGVKKIRLAYFGTADPIYYGINALYLPGSLIFSPRPESKDPEEPKYLAVSVTYVQGAFPDAALGDYYRSLRSKQPVATIGHSIFVYRLD